MRESRRNVFYNRNMVIKHWMMKLELLIHKRVIKIEFKFKRISIKNTFFCWQSRY